MYTLELTSDQLLMLQKMIGSDIDISSMDTPNYTDAGLMQYYVDRAKLYDLVLQELRT
ncbi:hypothetical protein CRP207_gp07 [Roseobacter phage CRP-207]|nr:hypothetical protein CRP207_gp07 [Roseobacter phage CRP-207]